MILMHPPSTQRAVARWHGGECSVICRLSQPWAVLFGVIVVPHVIVIAVGILCFAIIPHVVIIAVGVLRRRHQHCSTCHPPHEQLLMGLEAGGVSYWACRVLVSALTSLCSHRGGVLGPVLILIGLWCSFVVLAAVGMGSGHGILLNTSV
jgi:hypothetical protein